MDIQWWRLTDGEKFVYVFMIVLFLWLVVWQTYKLYLWFKNPDQRKWNRLSWQDGTKAFYLLVMVPTKLIGMIIGICAFIACFITGQTYEVFGWTPLSVLVSKNIYNSTARRQEEIHGGVNDVPYSERSKIPHYLRKDVNVVKNEKVKPKIRYGNRSRPKQRDPK